MFDSLQTSLKSAFKSLRGKGKLTEANMRDALRLVEDALIEADVNYDVVRHFLDRVSERALGQQVMASLNPDQQLLAIVHQELIDLLGPVDSSLHLGRDVNILMLCGLQGAGKTTTCGKLARLLLNNGVKPLLVAADLQRPAAIEQLHVLGGQLGVPVYSEPGETDPVKVCRNAVEKAKREKIKVVILDTAGRLAIDEELMAQLQRIDQRVQPHQVYLVVDGMTGQDAVNSAGAFNEALELDGVIMTKLDGDTRGGALLSVKHVTGVPIKFTGTGEQLDALEPFHPEGMAGRILDQGDLRALISTAQQLIDQEEQAALQQKMLEGRFTLDDFKNQLRSFAQPGLMQKLLGMLPGMGEMKGMLDGAEGGEMNRLIGIIDSMTPEERRNPKVIDQSRRNRIARGAGVQPQDVNGLVKQFETMAPLMQSMASGSMLDRMRKIRELQAGGMFDPGARGPRVKKGTGARLSSKEKARRKKQKKKKRR